MDLKGKSEYPTPKPVKVESKEGNIEKKVYFIGRKPVNTYFLKKSLNSLHNLSQINSL